MMVNEIPREKLFRCKTEYIDGEGCFFRCGRYPNGNVAIQVCGKEGEPLITCSVNPGEKLPDTQLAVKDYSENLGVAKMLLENGITVGEPIRTIESGYVEIPVYGLKEGWRERVAEFI